MDGDQTAIEYGGAEMSVPESLKRLRQVSKKAEGGVKIAAELSLERPKMSSIEISTDNGRISGDCADLYQDNKNYNLLK